MKKKKFRIISLSLVLSLVLNISMTSIAYASTVGWEKQGTPRYTNSSKSSSMINKSDISGSTIMNRLRNSYTYNTRMNNIKNAQWVQTHTYESHFNGGSQVRYWTEYTSSSETPDGQLGYTSWYDSPHGLVLDYLSPFSNSDKSVTVPSTDPVANDVVKDMIDYNKIQYGNSDSAFIASNGGVALSDAKSASALMRDRSSMNYPIYLNNGMDVDSRVMSAMNDKGVKNLYVMGGYARFNFTAGITKGYNIVRIGGINTQATYFYYQAMPSHIKSPQHYTGDENGIVINGALPPGVTKSYVNSQLEKYKNSQKQAGIS